MSNLWLFAILAWMSPAMAEDDLVLQGKLALWHRPVCTQDECKLPEATSVFWEPELRVPRPLLVNAPGRAQRELKSGPWTATLDVFWVKSGAPVDPQDYVVTQLRLRHEDKGLVAECSRYDKPSEVAPFPVGACSGRVEDTQYGLSMMRATSSKK